MKCRNVGKSFGEWENFNRTLLQKLVSLLEQLKDLAHWTKNRSVVMQYSNEDHILKVFEMGNKRVVFSEELVGHFWGEG